MSEPSAIALLCESDSHEEPDASCTCDLEDAFDAAERFVASVADETWDDEPDYDTTCTEED